MDSIKYTEDTSRVSTSSTDLSFKMHLLMVRTDNPELETERKSLLKNLYVEFDRYEDFLRRSTVSLLDRLKESRELLVKECKAQKQTLGKLQSKQGTYNSTTNRLQQEYDVALMNLRSEQARTLPAPYTSAEEYAAHDALIAILQSKFNDAAGQLNSHMQLFNSFEAALADAIKTHDELVLKHSDTCNQIDRLQGKKSTSFSREFGLQRSS